MKTFTILFDLDGTLIDSTSAILDSFEWAFLSCGQQKPDREYAKSLIGYTLEDIFFRLGVKDSQMASFINAYRQKYAQIYLAQTSLLPGAKEAIELGHSFARLGIVTTKSSKFLPELLKNLNVAQYFDVLIGRDNVTNPKPDAEPILSALSRLDGQDKTKAYMIGDTPLDALSAKNAGICALSVLCGYCDFNTLFEYNDKIFNTTLDAVKFLKTIS